MPFRQISLAVEIAEDCQTVSWLKQNISQCSQSSVTNVLNTHRVLQQDNNKHKCTFRWVVVKPRPNHRNNSTQHVATLMAQCFQAPAKRSKHFDTKYPNIIGHNMWRSFSHHVTGCCDMLRVENRTSSHALAKLCCVNLAERQEHHAKFTSAAWKIWPVSNLCQQHPTCSSTLQHVATWWPNACNMLLSTLLRYVALKCCDRLTGA